MPDQIITCSDCNTTFTFNEGEQAFFKDKGFNAPTRCAECRRRRKAEKMAREGNSGGYGGGGNRGGSRRDW